MFGPWIYALMAILQACYLHHVDFSFRLPCRVMFAYLSVFSAVSQYRLEPANSDLEAKVTASIPSIVTESFKYDATAVCSIRTASCQRRDFRTMPMVTKQDVLCWQYRHWYTCQTRCSLEEASVISTGTACQFGAGYALSSFPWSST